MNQNNSNNQDSPQSGKSDRALNLPQADLKIKSEDGTVKVYDKLRDKYVALTPEEFVRQHFVNYLINYLHYPSSLMANEVSIELNGTHKRCDTVIYNLNSQPFIIVEYKAPDVALTQNVFDQIVRYNMKLKAKYLIVTNGINHYCCVADYVNDSYHFLPKIPDYLEMKNPYSEN